MTPLIWTIFAVLAGLVAGRLHFRALRAGTDALIRDGSPMRALGLGALRFGVTIGLFVLAALMGVGPLAGAALGFALGRIWELRRGRAI